MGEKQWKKSWLGKENNEGSWEPASLCADHLEHRGCHSRKNKPITFLQLVKKIPLWSALSDIHKHTSLVYEIDIHVGMLALINRPWKNSPHAHYLTAQKLPLIATPHPLTYFPWLHVFISWMSICPFCLFSLFFVSLKISLYMCEHISVCAACLRFDSQREALPENRSLDTEKQQVKAIFWHLLVAAGLFVRPAQSQGYCVCVDLCVCSFQTGRGNQSGLVWSFVFIDKCTRQNRRTIEKFVFLWSPVGGCVCARKIGQILVMLNWSHESLKCFKVGWVLHTTACG